MDQQQGIPSNAPSTVDVRKARQAAARRRALTACPSCRESRLLATAVDEKNGSDNADDSDRSRCSDQRPCPRCTRYGLAATCGQEMHQSSSSRNDNSSNDDICHQFSMQHPNAQVSLPPSELDYLIRSSCSVPGSGRSPHPSIHSPQLRLAQSVPLCRRASQTESILRKTALWQNCRSFRLQNIGGVVPRVTILGEWSVGVPDAPPGSVRDDFAADGIDSNLGPTILVKYNYYWLRKKQAIRFRPC